MKEAPGLKTRALAAQILFDRGEAESVTSAIQEWKKAEYKHTKEFLDEQISLLENLTETEKICREEPENCDRDIARNHATGASAAGARLPAAVKREF